MSDYKTIDIINAMANHATDYSWETITPAVIFRSPIPPGNLTFDAMGIFSEGGMDTDKAGYGLSESRESFKWVLASYLDLSSLESQYQRHMEWRDEARIVVRRAIDQYWGLGGVVTLTNLDPSWESDFFEMGDDGSPIAHLVATSLRTGVEYREAF